jgi:hypothetical protein
LEQGHAAWDASTSPGRVDDVVLQRLIPDSRDPHWLLQGLTRGAGGTV